jgi:23S rRNA (cytosine1962-C5)-methyltransferase
MSVARVILKPRRAQPFYARHPWVFAGAVERVEGEPADGDEVDLLSSAGNFIARGLYNSRSKIRVRLYSWLEGRPLDRQFWTERCETAIRLRERFGLRGADRGCRLVFSEADILSGFTIDEYGRWLAVQFTALGLAQRREMFAEILSELIRPEGIYLRTERGIGQLEGLELQDGLLAGAPPPADLAIEENGLRFFVNLPEGQKTGFYLDQRDNRRAVAACAGGRRVLDAFSYSGGFGLNAARAGAISVECVDVSGPALELGRRNAALNSLSNVVFTRADVFSHLAQLLESGQRYDLVILDPPKFARSRGAIDDALAGYRRLQTLGIRLLAPDGILATCCCSGLISADMLKDLLAQLAAEEGRDIQVLQEHGQPPDHPVGATCPESAYLKCFISRVV